MVGSRVCIFAHYNRDDKLDLYVDYYLRALLGLVDRLIVVTTSTIPEREKYELECVGVEFVTRDNVGYDFYSYKTGIEMIELSKCSELILCNDSVFGPLFNLGHMFNEMAERDFDVWGVTASQEVRWHLQSYFLVFSRNTLLLDEFQSFWRCFSVFQSKREVIREGEVGLSRLLLRANCSLGSYIAMDDEDAVPFRHRGLRYLRTLWRRRFDRSLYMDVIDICLGRSTPAQNPTVDSWESAVSKDMPFVKRSALERDGDLAHKMDQALSAIAGHTKYPVELIRSYFDRRLRKIGQSKS